MSISGFFMHIFLCPAIILAMNTQVNPKTIRTLLILTAISGLLAVVLGAFGAHALKGQLPDTLLQAYKTGVLYQLVHTLGLLAVISLMLKISVQAVAVWLKRTAIFWLVGILLFCGSLYLLAVTPWRWLGPITPLGGFSFMLGWVCLIVAAIKLSPVQLKSD